MTANKMPEMPPAFSFHNNLAANPLYTADQMRAMYLAGLEAARQAVPPSAQKVGEDSYEIILPALTVTITTAASMGWNTAVLTTLTNLTALEQEAKK